MLQHDATGKICVLSPSQATSSTSHSTSSTSTWSSSTSSRNRSGIDVATSTMAVLGDQLAIDLAYSSLHGYRRKSQTISLSTRCIAQTAMFCLHRLPHASLLVTIITIIPKMARPIGFLLVKQGYDPAPADPPFGELFSHFWLWPGFGPALAKLWPGFGPAKNSWNKTELKKNG